MAKGKLINKLLGKAKAQEPCCEDCVCGKAAPANKLYKVSVVLAPALWYEDIKRYVYVHDNNAIVVESPNVEFMASDSWDVRRYLDNDSFVEVTVKTINNEN